MVKRRPQRSQCRRRRVASPSFPSRESTTRLSGARQKVINGLLRACEKRPVSADTIEAVADRIERLVQERGEKEVASSVIGEAVMRELHALDAVAYVRFASVYRSFGDVHEFMRELEELIAQRRATPRPRRPGESARSRPAARNRRR